MLTLEEKKARQKAARDRIKRDQERFPSVRIGTNKANLKMEAGDQYTMLITIQANKDPSIEGRIYLDMLDLRILIVALADRYNAAAEASNDEVRRARLIPLNAGAGEIL